jgi:hypothetical protein
MLAGAGLLIILILIGERKLGTFALVVPLVVVVLPLVMSRPFFMVSLTLGLTLFCEGPTFNVPLMHVLYNNVYGGLEPIDLLVTVTSFSVAADLLRRGRQPRLPVLPALSVMLIVFAMVDGILVGHGDGVGIKPVVLAVNPIVEIVVMTWVVFNLDLSDERAATVIKWCLAMAGIKAVMGLVVMSLGRSADVETNTTITYYEPTANWLGMMAVFGLLAAGLASDSIRARFAEGLERGRRRIRERGAADRLNRQTLIDTRASRRERRRWASEPSTPALDRRAPWVAPVRAGSRLAARLRSRWGVALFALVFACLLLSYRRSFWIGSALGLVILIPLASTARKRVMIIPVLILLGGAVWTLQAVDHQAVAPIIQRATSLQPTQLQANAEDRYRLDERANVIAEVERNPLTGIGVDVPWVATVRSMGIEHPNGRLYVDFGILFWWLKMGVLGAAAYIGLLIAMATLAIQVWRRHHDPWCRHFGLASLCAVIALAAIESTACFTGEDPRFCVLIGAQFGLLAALADRARDRDPIGGASTSVTDPAV